MATTTTTMTAAEFLASNPRDHADFVSCDDPRLESRLGRAGSLLLPNLVGLIRRMAATPVLTVQRTLQEIVDNRDVLIECARIEGMAVGRGPQSAHE